MRKTVCRIAAALAAVVAFSFQSKAACHDRNFNKHFGGIPPNQVPYEYTDPSNWAGVPTNDKEDMLAFAVSSNMFVRLPDEVTLGAVYYSGAGKLYLAGAKLTVDDSGWTGNLGAYKMPAGRLKTNPYVYANVTATRNISGTWYIAGDMNVVAEVTSSIGAQWWRGDWYANDPYPDRLGVFDIVRVNNSSSAMGFVGPPGTDARDSAGWSLVSGSAFATYVGSAIGTIAPGGGVSGEGIPSGAYVRRYFPDIKTIELSQPVTQTIASGTLHFADYHPVTVGHIGMLQAAGNSSPTFSSYMPAGGGSFTIKIDDLRSSLKGVGSNSQTATFSGGSYPARLVVGRSDNNMNAHVRFRDSTHMVYPQPTGGPAGLAYAADISFEGSSARIDVEAGVDAVYSNIVKMSSGTISKEGTGSLSMDLAATLITASSALVAAEGALMVRPRATVTTFASMAVRPDASADVVTKGSVIFSDLSLASGSTFDVSAGDSATFNNLSIVSGVSARVDAGKTVTFANLSLASGASFDISAGETVTIAKLTVAAGARCRIVQGNAVVSALEAQAGGAIEAAAGVTVDLSAIASLPAGVRLEGEGTFIIASYDAVRGADPGPDALLRLAAEGDMRGFKSLEVAVPGVPGDPAFWVDATKNVDLHPMTNGYANCVACWHDCRVRAGSSAYRDIYATNDFTGVKGPDGSAPSRRRTDVGAFTTIEHNGLVAFRNPGSKQDNYRWILSGMTWNKPITNIYAVFSVTWQQGSSGQAILGRTTRFPELGPGDGHSDFGRAMNAATDSTNGKGGTGSPSVLYLFSALAADCVKNGWIYAEGVRKPWKSVVYQNNAVEIRESHPLDPGGRADAFAILDCGGNTSPANCGCQFQIETIIYTNKLTMAEREQVFAYLQQKYVAGMNAGTTAGASRYEGDGHIGDLAVEEGKTVNIGVDGVVFADRMSGTGTLVKKGEGTLYADLVEGSSLTVDGGRMVVHSATGPVTNSYDSLPGDYFAHWDAANADSLDLKTYNETIQDGWDEHGEKKPGYKYTYTLTNMVNHWYDARHLNDGKHIYGTARKSDGRYRAGWLVTNALNGLPAVDYGPIFRYVTDMTMERRFFHEFHLTDKNEPIRPTPVTAMFMVKDTSAGGNQVLGDTNSGYGITRNSTTADYTVPIVASGNIGIGATLNGSAIDPTVSGYSGGWDLLSMYCYRPYRGNLLGANTPFTVSGGMKLGEVLVYTNAVGWADARRIEAYLGKKWFNRTTPYVAPSSAGTVTVAEGSTLVVEGDLPLTARSVGGSGTIEGNVKLAQDATLEVYVNEDGSVVLPSAHVTGSLDLSAGGIVYVTGYVSKIRPGTYTLLSATSVTAGKWTCVTEKAKRPMKIITTRTALLLVVTKRGFVFIVS